MRRVAKATPPELLQVVIAWIAALMVPEMWLWAAVFTLNFIAALFAARLTFPIAWIPIAEAVAAGKGECCRGHRDHHC